MTAKHFYGAYKKGRKAFQADGDSAVCPYQDKRGGRYNHIVTFSRAFIAYWFEGFEDAQAGRPDRYSDVGASQDT